MPQRKKNWTVLVIFLSTPKASLKSWPMAPNSEVCPSQHMSTCRTQHVHPQKLPYRSRIRAVVPSFVQTASRTVSSCAPYRMGTRSSWHNTSEYPYCEPDCAAVSRHGPSVSARHTMMPGPRMRRNLPQFHVLWQQRDSRGAGRASGPPAPDARPGTVPSSRGTRPSSTSSSSSRPRLAQHPEDADRTAGRSGDVPTSEGSRRFFSPPLRWPTCSSGGGGGNIAPSFMVFRAWLSKSRRGAFFVF
mmetsp:Transcript_1667/g.3568  ORF Transcript_1667/g.3568 Transcript_1667/m.3568 type:complete len:245 (-) Transcript_1667:37-771(-)